MLKKVLKYDLKWIYKVVGVFYILSLIFSLIARGLSFIENSAIFAITSQICAGIAVAMVLSSLINCIMRLWARFIKNIYKDESYLTHTLPVEKKIIYASKVISAVITIFTTAVVIVVCLGICYYSEENIEALKYMLELTASTYDITVVNILGLISVVLTLQMLFFVILGYVSIILGHKINTAKIAMSVVIGFALYMLNQMVNLAVIFIIGLFNSNIMNLINTTEMISTDIIKVLMYVAIGLNIIYVIFYYILGKKAFEKGVNVE